MAIEKHRPMPGTLSSIGRQNDAEDPVTDWGHEIDVYLPAGSLDPEIQGQPIVIVIDGVYGIASYLVFEYVLDE